MTKHQIIRALENELSELQELLEEDDCSPDTKGRIEKLRTAISVVNGLPPKCKSCGDKMFKENWEGHTIPCPECNSYGEFNE